MILSSDRLGEPLPERAHDNDAALERLQHAIDHVAHWLPTQGPIAVFVHHNTLHSLEDLPFEEAVIKGWQVYGCQPYLSEDRYRAKFARGRFLLEDLIESVEHDLGADGHLPLGPRGTQFDVVLAMLAYPLRSAPDNELSWIMAESDAVRKFRSELSAESKARIIDDARRWVMRDLVGVNSSYPAWIRELAENLIVRFGKRSLETWTEAKWEAFTLELLWAICEHRMQAVPFRSRKSPTYERLSELLYAATSISSDALVSDHLIRFCGAFLDQGLAHWSMPDREKGFFRAFCSLYRSPPGSPEKWLQPLPSEIDRIESLGLTALQSIQESIEQFGIAADELESFLTQKLLVLRGWGGMLHQMETNAEWTVWPAPKGSLVDFLAVRLILDRLAVGYVAANELGYSGTLKDLRAFLRHNKPNAPDVTPRTRAFHVFQIAQLRGWTAAEMYALNEDGWQRLSDTLENYSSLERRRLMHVAYERRFRQNALDAIASHLPANQHSHTKPSFQLITCIDDREESFRRHVEECEPTCETFGAAGFFSVPMYYRGVNDAHYVPLCPIVIKPKHFVREEVVSDYLVYHARRERTRKALGRAIHRFHVGTRSFIAGAFTSLIGNLASIPLVARVLFPHATARVRRVFGNLVRPPVATELVLEREASEPAPEPGHLGFTLQEMADMVARLLRDMGLIESFSDLVIIAGHGSSSLNNPHESAYNCGACGGGRGGPNARAIATLANDPRVRELLAAQGLKLPAEMYFVGAYHNTCDDSLTFFDLDRLPVSHRDRFEKARQVLETACEHNAHERCRRFESAPLILTPEAALHQVQERSEDLSQARPEYNHATCAIGFVGRRARTRGLFLDRRCFLTSYDPTTDDRDATLLARILAAVFPVCAGISLEYYFSCVDPPGYGCGSKLPHNITSLLGVMEGAASDLRTGLSQQMVEIHEPMRILFVIECTPQAMLRIIDNNPTIGNLCRNRWVQVAVLDPDSQIVQVYNDGAFTLHEIKLHELPKVTSSLEWYRGQRSHLGFAEVVADGRQRVSSLN